MTDRLTELTENLERVRRSIADACTTAGRSPDEVTLVAITKTFPLDDVRALAGLGVTDLGENREQELKAKAPEAQDLDVTWHFVGQLQSKKARSVVRYADVVHSVDRLSLVTALSRAATGLERSVRCLLQVSLAEYGPGDDPGSRGGVEPGDVPALADAVAAADGLELGGVMAVAPLGGDPEKAFDGLASVAARLRSDHPGADWISAGMSADLEAAITRGATHVRLGRALLGTRPVLG